MFQLDELQLDAITEVFNMGMGSAAAALSEMVNEEILLSVPDIKFVSKHDAATLLSEQVSNNISGVSQRFNGPFGGTALLLFPEDQSLAIVRLLLRDTVPLDNITELEQEALCEIGNIILNAGLSSLADMFQHEINSSLPNFAHGTFYEVLDSENQAFSHHQILLLHVNFKLKDQAIDGYVIFLLDVQSQLNLTKSLDKYLNSLQAM